MGEGERDKSFREKYFFVVGQQRKERARSGGCDSVL